MWDHAEAGQEFSAPRSLVIEQARRWSKRDGTRGRSADKATRLERDITTSRMVWMYDVAWWDRYRVIKGSYARRVDMY